MSQEFPALIAGHGRAVLLTEDGAFTQVKPGTVAKQLGGAIPLVVHGPATLKRLGNPSIQQLVQSGDVRFLPIAHAAAMKIKQPAFNPAVIPEGAYLGNPPVPDRDLPTVAVHRTLLALDSAAQSLSAEVRLGPRRAPARARRR